LTHSPTPSRRRWPGAVLKDPIPRRGFPGPLRSAFAVSHDLDGLPLFEPSAMFQTDALMEFVYRWKDPPESVTIPVARRLPAWLTDPPGSRFATGSRAAEATRRPTRLRRGGDVTSLEPARSLRGVRPSARHCRARRDRRSHPVGRDGQACGASRSSFFYLPFPPLHPPSPEEDNVSGSPQRGAPAPEDIHPSSRSARRGGNG
jgi:hypothetical protein